MAEETRIEHPNRDKAGSKAAKAVIVLLMLVTAGLVLIITLGGWAVLQGAQIVAIAYVLLYLVMAFYVARWNRGLLPVAAALSTLLAVMAAVAAPGWFARDKTGFEDPAIAASLLGLLTIILVPVSVVLVVFAMRGFAQKWNVEVEEHRDDYEDDYDYYDYNSGGRGASPAGA
jgi:presenilin-like A22 family membrane protease